MSFGGTEPLVPKMNRKLERIFKMPGKISHLLCLGSSMAAHSQRIAHHYFLNSILGDELSQLRQIMTPIAAVQGVNTLRSDAQRIGDGDPDAPRSYIESQNAACAIGSGILTRSHAAIIGGRRILPSSEA